MNKTSIAALAIAATFLNASATIPAVQPEETELSGMRPAFIEVLKAQLPQEKVLTFMDLGEHPEAFPEHAREAQARLRAEIEAEEAAARARSVNYGSSKKGKAIKKASPGTITVTATAYTHTGNQTATGTWPEAGRTIATDPRVIPSGTHVRINGVEYIAEDTGSAIKGNKIDIFMDTAAECDDWGIQPIEIEILE